MTAPIGGGQAVDPTPAAPADTAASGAFLAVDGEGLRVFDAATGQARPIPFGAPKAEVLASIRALQDGPPAEEGESPDCGLSYATWPSGLTVTFAGDRFAGWSTRAGDRPLTTASGIGIGSTRREVESAYDARFIDSSLGVEFSAGSLAGVLDSAAAEGRVIALWAGLVCLAR